MTSLKKQPIRKGWREYPKRIIIKFIELAFCSIGWIIRYSGLEFIYRKFNPPKNPQPLPTGFIWLIGIYIALFGVASQRYENRVDIIENRANSIFSQLATEVYKKALSRISTVQNMWCPEKPKILNPPSVIRSLYKETEYQELVELFKETIENWKEKLDGINLNQANLLRANLREADLSKANLEGANLEGANLEGANLQGANLQEANLQGADLSKANLEGANLIGANLLGAGLWDANLQGADLIGANLWAAKLAGANLREADLSNAQLRHAYLFMANLQGAYLFNARLREADLRKADLRGADFEFADLQGANLQEAKFLCEAKSFYKAKLDPKLEKQIKDKCSRILKLPKLPN